MMDHFAREQSREYANIGMTITTSTDGESLAVPVRTFINQLILGKKLVGITSDDGINLEICKEILESNFDNPGLFDLGKPMFAKDCLDHFLANDCKAEVMDVKYND